MRKRSLIGDAIESIIGCSSSEVAVLTVKNLARKLDVSPEHLSRTFHKNFGIHLKEYLLREKITRSQFMLVENRELTVNNVGRYFDFNSGDYFIRVFKKYVGMTPGRYRQMKSDLVRLKDRRRGLVGRRNRESLTRGAPDKRSGLADRRFGPMSRRISMLDRRD